MNKRRKAKKAKELGDYHFFSNSPNKKNDLKWIKQYEKVLWLRKEVQRYNEDVFYRLWKLYFYNRKEQKGLNAINICLKYSWANLDALELKVEILRYFWREEEANNALKKYEIELERLENTVLDLDKFYNKN